MRRGCPTPQLKTPQADIILSKLAYILKKPIDQIGECWKSRIGNITPYTRKHGHRQTIIAAKEFRKILVEYYKNQNTQHILNTRQVLNQLDREQHYTIHTFVFM